MSLTYHMSFTIHVLRCRLDEIRVHRIGSLFYICCASHEVRCTMYCVRCILYDVRSRHYDVRCAMYDVFCAMCVVRCIVYCAVYIV